MGSIYTYRNIDGLTKFLQVMLGVGLVLAVVGLVSSFLQLELLARESFTEAEANANDARESFIGLISILLRLATAVVFGIWIVRANKNVRALGAVGLRMTPGWALGYFFVPILNLFRPYQAMSDLWRASQDPAAWQSVSASAIVPIWWTLWIGDNIVGQVAFRLGRHADTIEVLKGVTNVQITATVIDAVLCVVAALLVQGIATAQKSRMPAMA
jgi:hypothetical protein